MKYKWIRNGVAWLIDSLPHSDNSGVTKHDAWECLKPMVGLLVKVLYPFKSVIKKLADHSRLLYNVYCTLEQERIARLYK